MRAQVFSYIISSRNSFSHVYLQISSKMYSLSDIVCLPAFYAARALHAGQARQYR